VSKSSGANSDAQKPEIDADLAKVVTAWPKLGQGNRMCANDPQEFGAC